MVIWNAHLYFCNKMYSQTLANDHLQIATTCLQRPRLSPILNFFNHKCTSEQRPPVINGRYFWVPWVLGLTAFMLIQLVTTLILKCNS